jgi:CubicO group peptidase (beta-lactamase class C family)
MINRSGVSGEKQYRYSGLAFLLFPKVISDLSGQSYAYYLKKHFYLPMEALTLDFNPKLEYFQNPIVPTERDTLYRKTLTQGWVHDENASLMGGISGNAGLFGTARDLAKIMIMYQNYGNYGGRQYLKKETLEQFTAVQFPQNDNRRALGFDKPLLNNQNLTLQEAYPAPEVSPESFGHSGFTGTFVWADPKNQLVFIFLSNRVYPYRSHRQLYELNIRWALQQVFYKTLLQN